MAGQEKDSKAKSTAKADAQAKAADAAAEETKTEAAATEGAKSERAKADVGDKTAEEVEAEVMEEAAAAVAGVAEEEQAKAAGEDPVATAKAEAKEWQDKYLRLHAEWDTYRRRMNEQRAEEKLRATEKLVEGLIPIIDDFERSIAYAEQNGEEGLLGGVKAVSTKLSEVLAKEGVEVIDPAGQAFDALEAQAVATVPDETVPDETVAEVYQKGYRMGNKVLRAAMVTVTTGGPRREKPTDDDGNEE